MVAKATVCETPCVAVVDDDYDTRLYLNDLLQAAQDFCCAGCFATATEALMHIPRVRPQLVTMDIRLPDVDGITCTMRLKEMLPEMKIVIMTGMHDATLIEESLRAGATAYLTKPVTAEQFLATLRFAATETGPQRGNDAATTTSLSDASLPVFPVLTVRERQVMKHLAEGLLYKEIAAHLGLSYSAVHKHQQKIFLKYSVGNRSEAIRKWRDFGGV